MTVFDVADALMVAAPLVVMAGTVYAVVMVTSRPRRETTRVLTLLVRESERTGPGRHRRGKLQGNPLDHPTEKVDDKPKPPKPAKGGAR